MEQPLENQLFDWDHWDQFDTMGFSFYNVVLKNPIGEYPAGTQFPFASMDYEKSVISLYSDLEDESPVKFELLISVGNKL